MRLGFLLIFLESKSLCPHRRNVPDEVLDKLKKNDGVICITFVPGGVFPFFFFLFLFFSCLDFVNCTAPASLNDVANHFIYVKNRIGARHLCIGAGWWFLFPKICF